MSKVRSLEEKKRIENDMWEHLGAIPLAKGNPFSHYEALLQEMSILEKTIKRLKAFIAFLRKLNPAQYIKWMNDAFSRYTPSKKLAPTTTQPTPALRKVELTPPTIKPTKKTELPSATYKP